MKPLREVAIKVRRTKETGVWKYGPFTLHRKDDGNIAIKRYDKEIESHPTLGHATEAIKSWNK